MISNLDKRFRWQLILKPYKANLYQKKSFLPQIQPWQCEQLPLKSICKKLLLVRYFYPFKFPPGCIQSISTSIFLFSSFLVLSYICLVYKGNSYSCKSLFIEKVEVFTPYMYLKFVIKLLKFSI